MSVFEDAALEAPPDVEFVDLRTVAGRIWLPQLSEVLVAEGITRLLVEGGPRIWQAMMEARMVDEIVVYRALSPGDGETTNEALPAARDQTFAQLRAMNPRIRLACHAMRKLDNDAELVFRRTLSTNL
ncbi:MAG: dihydrofolate reductase family protein [Pseudomonadota bacterium]